MSATVFTFLELALFFGFIIGVGLWQLREVERDQARTRARDAKTARKAD